MKFTFLKKKRVGYFEGDKHGVADGEKGDFFFIEDKKEIERLKDLKEFGYKVFSFEDVKEETKEVIEKVEETKSLEELQKEYVEVLGKNFPPQEIYGQNAVWLSDKIEEAKKKKNIIKTK